MLKFNAQKIIIYTDGGARGNPGPAGIGVVIKDEKENLIKNYSQNLGEKTNNEAEYEAVIYALKKAKHLFGKEKVKNMNFEIRTDSELVCRQLRGKYKIEEERLFPLFIKIWNLKIEFGGSNIFFNEISRSKNKEADRLVNEALDQKDLQKMF